jgi:hypothetical protein
MVEIRMEIERKGPNLEVVGTLNIFENEESKQFVGLYYQVALMQFEESQSPHRRYACL